MADELDEATPAAAPAAAKATKQTALSVDVVKQYPGQQQVDRRVIVNIPGKFFPQLTGAEQAAFYSGEPVEFKERHKFGVHNKAWGAAHTGPGMRVICKSDAIDDPDYHGFWTTLALLNRWRHETYKSNRSSNTLRHNTPHAWCMAMRGIAPAARRHLITWCRTGHF